MRSFKHHNAGSVREAVALLHKCEGKAKVSAGGTDLLGLLKDESLSQYPEAVINLKNISGLEYIKEDAEGMKIGALTKLSAIADSPAIKEKYLLLSEAAKSVATPQIRNMGTIGGNLAQDVRCWYYRYPDELGGSIKCLRKGGKQCNALPGDNRYHSIFGAAGLTEYPCATACPAKTNIPAYLGRIKKGDLLEASRALLDFNPMPAITGRVCPIFCEPGCNRGDFDEPVAIRCIERTLGDYILDRTAEFYTPPRAESGKSVAIIGSGPAGLAAAYYLRSSGHLVTVFEKMSEAGGMLQHSIPAYRLPKDVVRNQVQALQGMGVKLELGTNVSRTCPAEESGNTSIADLMGCHSAVFLSSGAWKEKPMGIKGEQYALSGLVFLNRTNSGIRNVPGKKVAVIGGGNVAMDVARTLLRLGAEPEVLYRRSRDEMPAFKEELEKAEAEGIKFRFLILPADISKTKNKTKLICLRMKLGATDASGRRQPVPRPNSNFTLIYDAVIKAIGEEPDVSILPAGVTLKSRKPETLALWLGKNLFAGGDFIKGPSTVVEAVAAGRQAAHLIDLSLKDGHVNTTDSAGKADFTGSSFSDSTRVKAPGAAISERVKDFDAEDTLDINLNEMRTEAGRCFDCGCLAVNPSDVGVALVALEAKIATTKRTVTAENFFNANATESTILEPDEVVTEVQIPRPAEGSKQSYLKFTVRKPVDFAIASVASVITVKDGTCTDARIVLGAVAPEPIRAGGAEEVLKGCIIDESTAAKAAEEALAGANPLGKNVYKVEIAKTLVKRAILGQSR
jgi:NADPH-dependent glutamate synthase beta subunit-like oxidoreductase/CO/xanthine dehydrogenase FAD-binding subunit